MPTNYRALLAMTRLLVVTEDTPLSLLGEELSLSDSGSSREPAYWYAELTLWRGQILRPGLSGQGMGSDECTAATGDRVQANSGPEGECDAGVQSVSASRQTGSNLKLRIYLGMS